MFPASFIFTPAHLHTREFSGYRIPSLAPVPHISLSSHHQPSLFCQFPSLSSSAVSSALWGGCTQADGGMSLTPLTAHYSFSCYLTLFPHTQMCTTISTPCPYSVLDEWQHQSAIYRSCVWRPIITLELMCALVCVSVLSSVRYDTSWTFQFPVRYFPSSPWTLSEKNT